MQQDKQKEMELYYDELLNIILAEEKVGLVPTLKPKFIQCNYDELSLTIEFKVMDWQINPEKILFGGIIVSMIDCAYGFLCHYFAQEKFISTIGINTVFLKPGMLDDIIRVKVKAISHGRTIINMTGEAFDITQNKMLATSQTSFMILDKKVEL